MIARTGSVAIRTDNVHYKSDLLLNGSVIVALVLDQYAAARRRRRGVRHLIALWLLWGAWRASSHALDQLMDREWPEDERASDSSPPRSEYPELAGLHDLRTRSSGTHHFAQFHVWVPADWTVQEAHDRLDRGRGGAAASAFPGTEILIHVDPEGQTDRETLLPSGHHGASDMTSIPFFQVDAFAERPLTGNPAAVMPLERWLDDALMQAIAAENNLSETAFTVPSEQRRRRLRPALVHARGRGRAVRPCDARRRPCADDRRSGALLDPSPGS